MTLSFSKGLLLMFLSLTGGWHFSRIRRKVFFAIFCPKILFYSFPGAWLTWSPSLANFCPELKILLAGVRPRVLANKSAHLFTPNYVLKLKSLFQISSDEKILFSALKASANHLAPSSSTTSSGHATQWPTLPSPSTGHRSWSADSP